VSTEAHYETVECKLLLGSVYLHGFKLICQLVEEVSFFNFQPLLRVVFQHTCPCSICRRTWNYLCTWVTSWSSHYLWQHRQMNCSNMQRDLVMGNMMPQQFTSVLASECCP